MAVDDILKAVPVDDIAKRLGVSPDVAQQAIEQAGGALLSGLAKNAESAEGSAAIQKALSKHEGFSGASSVEEIDEADGEKIVKHVFGEKEKEVAATLNSSEKTAGGIDFGKLLPILAPIVMGLIANGAKSKSEPAEPKSAPAEQEGGGGFGDVIGGLLGGSGGGGIDLGGVIGGLLGGGDGKSGGGIDLGGLLGGLLGGGKK